MDFEGNWSLILCTIAMEATNHRTSALELGMEATQGTNTAEEFLETSTFFAGIAMPENMPKIMDMHLELMTAEKKFRRACEQIVNLNSKMNSMTWRYDRAKMENRRSFRYTLRLQLAVIEGVRNTYYDYAQTQAMKINKLRVELYGEHAQDDNSDDEMETEESED